MSVPLARELAPPAGAERARWTAVRWFVVDEPVVAVGLLILVLVLLCLVAPGLVSGQDPNSPNLLAARQGPSAAHWFGTDDLGRDVFSRVVHGARLSLLIGVGSTLLAALLGCTIGIVAGYAGGVVDSVLSRGVDVLLAFPGILLALAIVAVYGPGTATLLIGIGVINIPGYARVIRGEIIATKARPFVEAAVSTGATRRRIVLRHLLPNALPPVIVMATVGVGFSLLAASALSFLGLGPQPPTAEWGAMLSESRDFLQSAWWMAVFPGLAILLTVASINVVGQWLRERLDPRARR